MTASGRRRPLSPLPVPGLWRRGQERGAGDPGRWSRVSSFLSPARKTSKQVFVSYNLQNTDSSFALLVENRIKEEMEAFPEKF